MRKFKYDAVPALVSAGIHYGDAEKLRRIAMTLHRWFEMECGTGEGCIERDEETGKTYWLNAITGNRHATPDRETGAMNRLSGIMENYPALGYYIQSDPRGAPLYILRPGDVPKGEDADCYYNRGIVVCK